MNSEAISAPVLLALFCTVTVVVAERSVVISTRLGSIEGSLSTITIGNSTFDIKVFKKIPYAKPPIGDLRFEDPVQYGKWNGTLSAIDFGPSCYQPPFPILDQFLPNTVQAEDCLFLNIYAPAHASDVNKKSVMVWIHGGGYVIGSGMFYNASRLSSIGDVIVVTFNYRLNAFGFFRTKDDHNKGNYGLNDQTMALRWVKDNIDSFGGDPESITIFGESAGGFSVSLQAINAKNIGLFRRVIQQSGTQYSPNAIASNPYIGSDKLLEKVNCTNGTIKERVLCVKSLSPKLILKASTDVTLPDPTSLDVNNNAIWAPMIEADILYNSDSPGNIFYKSLDVIVGNCQSEGSLLLDDLTSKKDSLPFNIFDGISSDFFRKHIIGPLIQEHIRNSHDGEEIFRTYNGNGSLAAQGQEVINFSGDFYFVYPAIRSLFEHTTNKTDQKSQFQYMHKRRSILSSPENLHPWFTDAGHGDELPYLFPFSFLLPFNEHDEKLSESMIKYWSNFAKTGNVNGEGLSYWPPYELETKKYMEFNYHLTVKQDLYKDRMEFWKALMNKHGTTTPCSQPSCIFG